MSVDVASCYGQWFCVRFQSLFLIAGSLLYRVDLVGILSAR